MNIKSTLLAGLALIGFLQLPALACLSCSCGGSGSAADLGGLGGASSLFAGSSKWLIQTGLSASHFSGSFNENGVFNPAPKESLALGLQGVLGAMYYPSRRSAIGVQIPLRANALYGSTWGPFGSLQPTYTGENWGAGLGDIRFQGSYQVFQNENFALSPWLGLQLPSGQANAKEGRSMTGSGAWTGMTGLTGLWKPGFESEFFANIGYLHTLYQNSSINNPFFMGRALVAQIQGNYNLLDNLSIGLGIQGQIGFWQSETSAPMQNLQIMPSVQYDLDMYSGLRGTLSWSMMGRNTLRDQGLTLVYYQYFE